MNRVRASAVLEMVCMSSWRIYEAEASNPPVRQEGVYGTMNEEYAIPTGLLYGMMNEEYAIPTGLLYGTISEAYIVPKMNIAHQYNPRISRFPPPHD